MNQDLSPLHELAKNTALSCTSARLEVWGLVEFPEEGQAIALCQIAAGDQLKSVTTSLDWLRKFQTVPDKNTSIDQVLYRIL